MKEIDRRRFVKGSLASGFAAAALPISATTLTTPLAGLVDGVASIPAAGARLPAYWARPSAGDNWPVVIVVQEIFGVHEHIRDVCRRFARRGVLAVASDYFVRQGDPTRVSDMNELMQTIVAKVPDSQVMADIDATIAWAQQQGGTDAIGITGFCWGGRITWLHAAHNPAVRAGVAWYGRLLGATNDLQPRHPVEIASQLRAPVLGLYGGLDRGIPLDSVESMRQALSAETASEAARASRIIVYPDAGHGFYADYRPSYRAADASSAFESCCDWFRQRGVMPDDKDS